MATFLSQIQIYPDSVQEQKLLQHGALLSAARCELQRADMAHKNVFRKSYKLPELFFMLKQMCVYNPAYSALYEKSINYVAREVSGHKVSFLPATSDIITYPIQIPVPSIELPYGCFVTKKYGRIPMNGSVNPKLHVTDAYVYRTSSGWMLSLLTA